jgi:preprotein translocase subunit SecE
MTDTPPRKRKLVVSRDFDPSRWAHAAFFLGFLMLAYVLSNFTEDAWAILWSYYPQSLSRPSGEMSTAIGVGTALFGAVLAWRNKRWFKFVSEVATEVSQVTWPTRAETRAATIVVIVLTIICSIILAIMDLFWSNVTDWLYSL